MIVFRTMSKAYGLAGLSFGYAIAPKALAQDFIAGGWSDINALNRLSLAATEAALKDQEYISWVNELVTRERNQWHAFLDELGLQHTASRANFVFFDANMPHAEVQDRLKRAGIVIGRSLKPSRKLPRTEKTWSEYENRRDSDRYRRRGRHEWKEDISRYSWLWLHWLPAHVSAGRTLGPGPIPIGAATGTIPPQACCRR